MKKILSIISAIVLTAAFLSACSSSPSNEIFDILTRFSTVEQGTLSGAARITFPKEISRNKILSDFDVQDQPEDIVFELFFNIDFNEPEQKAKLSISNNDNSHLTDVYIDSEKYYVEMENAFTYLHDKMGIEFPFTKEAMGQQKFVNIPKNSWQSHLLALYTALNTAISNNEDLLQTQEEYYYLTLTSPEFAASLTSPYKEWMADGYNLTYGLIKKDLFQALTLTIPDQIKIELQWSLDAQGTNITMPEGILLANLIEKKSEEEALPEVKPNEKNADKDKESPVEDSQEQATVNEPQEEHSKEKAQEQNSVKTPNEKEPEPELKEPNLKSIMNSVIKEIAPDRKLLTANIFNQNTNIDTLMNSTAKWLSPLTESYRQTDTNFTYLGLTSLRPESCLPSERDAVNINFYKVNEKKSIEIFIEYDEPDVIKKMLNLYAEICKKCGYVIDKDSMADLINILERDAKLLIKSNEKDYYMEEIEDANVKLKSYVAFTGSKYIYMITLSEEM